MITERATLPTAWRFLARRLNGATRLLFAAAVALTILGIGLVRAGIQSEALADSSHQTDDSDWSELIASMDKMHNAMGAVERSGNSDVDFVRLMLPHHQAAIDMAKTQILHGKDPKMRRLAQEIITDQQLEIELMQPIDTRDSATSTLGAVRHSNLQSRPRLHCRSNFEHGFSDRPGGEQVAGCNPTRRSCSWSAESALQRTASCAWTRLLARF